MSERASFDRRRLRALAASSLAVLVVSAGLALDARARSVQGRASRERVAPIVRGIGLTDLALSTRSTWLRHPALAARAAGVSDAPIGLDVDPAGAAIAPRDTERSFTLRREAP